MASPNSIARYLLKSVNRAVREFALIQPGDRIAVGVSGGKDSRALLDLLLRGVDIPPDAQNQGPDKSDLPYSVVAIHIDGKNVGLPNWQPRLEPWFQALGVAYTIAPLEVPTNEPLPMDCFRCAWNRRKALFFAADAANCNKVAFGHHADDATTTTLLNLMYKGKLETLEPRLSFFDGHFIVIRPLIYLSEVESARYARACGWDIPSDLECPRGNTSRRVQLEQFLSTLSNKERQQIRANLWRATRDPTRLLPTQSEHS